MKKIEETLSDIPSGPVEKKLLSDAKKVMRKEKPIPVVYRNYRAICRECEALSEQILYNLYLCKTSNKKETAQ